MTLVLASTSPRRYQILSLLHLPFLMVPPAYHEEGARRAAPLPVRPPADEALVHARRKAESLCARFPDAIVIGSDTLISLDGAALGKPKDEEDSRALLQRLRGRTHDVVTAVCLLSGRGTTRRAPTGFEWVETARVSMRDFTEAELERYVATGDPLDKAGAYSIQGEGRGLVAGFEGDYLSIVGLPLRAVARGLTQIGIEITVDLDRIYQEREFLNWKTFS